MTSVHPAMNAFKKRDTPFPLSRSLVFSGIKDEAVEHRWDGEDGPGVNVSV